MKKATLNVMLLLVSSDYSYAGFQYKVGLSFNLDDNSRPEHELARDNSERIDFGNPLGILRMEYKTQKGNTLFCEHISSIPSVERGNGFNHCGFMMGL